MVGMKPTMDALCICFHPQGPHVGSKAGERLERRGHNRIHRYTQYTLQKLKIEITKKDFGSTVQRQNLLLFVGLLAMSLFCG